MFLLHSECYNWCTGTVGWELGTYPNFPQDSLSQRYRCVMRHASCVLLVAPCCVSRVALGTSAVSVRCVSTSVAVTEQGRRQTDTLVTRSISTRNLELGIRLKLYLVPTRSTGALYIRPSTEYAITLGTVPGSIVGVPIHRGIDMKAQH